MKSRLFAIHIAVILICFIPLVSIWLMFERIQIRNDLGVLTEFGISDSEKVSAMIQEKSVMAEIWWQQIIKAGALLIGMVVLLLFVHHLMQIPDENYRKIFHEMSEAFALHRVIYNKKLRTFDYIFLFVNPAFERITGLKTKNLIGKSVRQVMPNLDREWMDTYVEVVKKNKSIYFEKYDKSLDKYFRVCAYSPSKGHFACVFSDITESKKTEEKLRKSENRYREIIDVPFALIFRWYPDTTITYSNKAYAKSLKMTPEEIVGKCWIDIIPKEQISIASLRRQELLQSKEVSVFEYEIPRRDKPSIWLSWTNIPILDEDKNIVEIETFGYNITDRKRAEQELITSKKLLEIKNQIAQFFLLNSDEQMYTNVLRIILEALESPYGSFGYIQDNNDLIIPAHFYSVRKEQQETIVIPNHRWPEIWQKTVNEKTITCTNTPIESPEGHWPILRSVLLPVVQANKSIGLIMIANKATDYKQEDVTFLQEISRSIAPILRTRLDRDRQESKRRKAEERLDQAQALLQVAIQSTPIGIIIADVKSNKIRYANNAALEMRGKSSMLLTNIDIQDHVTNWKLYEGDGVRPCALENSPLSLAIKERIVSKNVEMVMLTEKEEKNFISVIASPIIGRENEVVAAVMIFQNVTQQYRFDLEKKKLHEQLLQSQKMESIGRLAAGIAHDFNNVLSIIIGYTEMLLYKRIPNESILRSYLEEIHNATERAKQITTQLLAFSRKQKLEMQIVNINTVIENFKKMLRQLVREDIEIKYDFTPNLGSCKVDTSQIGQVLMNLCANSRDAMPNGGTITIQTTNIESMGPDANKRFIVISVSDTGIGMDETTIDHLFEPFYTTKEKGNGLGLATVYGLVKQHGGKIFVRSKIGYGTTFMVYLPQVSEMPSEQNPYATKRMNDLPKLRGTILLVEDEVNLCKMVSNILQQLGFKVLEFLDSFKALEFVVQKNEDIDLLLSDVVIPGIAGPILAKEIQQYYPKIKILYMSGYPEEILLQYGISPHNAHFLQKPLYPDTLLQKIQQLFS